MARSKSRRRRIVLISAGGALVALVAIGSIWVVYLDHLVTRQFQGRHWSVPARVYAEPLDLYVGASVTADDLEEELRRLHYRSGDPAAGPGIYRRRGGYFDLHARRVRFVDELRDPEMVSIRAGSDSIMDLEYADGRELP